MPESDPLLLPFNPSKQPHRAEGLILENGHRPPAEFGVETLQLDESLVRHVGWADVRAKVWKALRAAHVTTARLERFAECGSGLWLLSRPADLSMRLSCNCCRDRWCQPCAATRGRQLASALLAQISDLERARFVTLTLKHRPCSLRDCLDRLYRSFNALRRRPLWSSAVVGCAVVCEIKVGRDGLWHPHLHIICEGGFIDQRALSQDWLAVTGDSSIVDIRLVKNAKTLAFYVVKYVSKSADSTVLLDHDRLLEAVTTLRGRRLAMTAGTWRRLKLLPPADDDVRDETDDKGEPLHSDESLRWKPLHRVSTLAKFAREDAVASAVWHEVIARWPALRVLYDPLSPS